MTPNTTPKYYARTIDELDFDTTICKAVIGSNDKAAIALYLQNLEILSILRRLEERGDSNATAKGI